jgi:2-methylcitrate dehydratase PrpD
MLNALGTAGTQAAGLWEFNHDGAMSKHLHPGKAAQNGMLAADLAREGFTGGSRILEGDRGFFRAMSEGFDASRISDGLGARWKILENGYKLHSCCGHTHSAIDLALRLRQDNLAAMAAELENVREINVYTYGPGFEIVRQTNPTTPYEAKFSLAYCVAAAFLEGRVGLGQFSADRFGGKGVISESHARLLTRIHVHVSDELTSKYPVAWPARIELRLGDGSGRSAGQDFPDGSPERPVSTAMLEEKFLALVGGVHGTHTAARALERVRSLELNPDVSSGFADVQPSGALR